MLAQVRQRISSCKQYSKGCNVMAIVTELIFYFLCIDVTCVLVHVQVWIGVGPQTLSCSHHARIMHLPPTDVCVCVCVCVHVCLCVQAYIRSSGDYKITWGLLAHYQRLAMKFIVMYTGNKGFRTDPFTLMAWSLPNASHATNREMDTSSFTSVMATMYTSASGIQAK